jgi:hypothetical protein
MVVVEDNTFITQKEEILKGVNFPGTVLLPRH